MLWCAASVAVAVVLVASAAAAVAVVVFASAAAAVVVVVFVSFFRRRGVGRGGALSTF